MAKRTATSELTDRNWDQEDEPEEAGEFSRATEDAMKGRKILQARRKQPAAETGNKPAFAGFGGFSFKPTQTSTPLLGFSGFKTESKLGNNVKVPKETEESKLSSSETNGKQLNGSNKTAESSTYLHNLKALNQSVLNWISQHVEKNPYCILSPIFKDYENHLSQLEKEKSSTESNGSEKSKEEKGPAKDDKMEESKPELPKTGLTFGMGNLNTAKSEAKPPVFGGFNFSNTAPSTGASGFSFAVGSSAPSAATASGSKDEEEEYVPPKVEVVEHKEEGSLFSKKCKLFYQKDGSWTERGVGFLHIKKNDDKAQLLVRADNTLGNIILNVRLSESIPLARQGKNNVSMMTVLNPAVKNVPDDKPVPLLIRVKSAEDADELLDKMKELRS